MQLSQKVWIVEEVVDSHRWCECRVRAEEKERSRDEGRVNGWGQSQLLNIFQSWVLFFSNTPFQAVKCATHDHQNFWGGRPS